MSTKKEKKNNFLKNVIMLICSQVLIKILGLIYRLVIVNFDGFGDVGNGYYSTGYNLYALLLTLSSIGIPSVISKLISERLANEDKEGAQKLFKVAMIFFVGIGTILSLGLFIFADVIATKFYGVPFVKYVLRVLAPAIMFVSSASIFRGYFAGQNDMKATSVSQTLEQFFNCVLSITFVYFAIGKEPYIMAAAGNLSTTLAVIIAFSYLIGYYKKHKIICDNTKLTKKESLKILKVILSISIPITLGSIISVVNPVLDNTTVTNCIKVAYSGIINTEQALQEKAMSLVGMLSKADTLINLPLAVNLAFETALVPVIAAAFAKGDLETAKRKIKTCLIASIIIITPCTIGYITLADPIFNMLYPNAPQGAGILKILSISMFFVALSQTVNGALYGTSKVRVPVLALAIGVLVKLIVNLILVRIPSINIYGAAIGSVCCQLVAFIISYCNLRKIIKLDLSKKNFVVKPIIASFIMGVIVYLLTYLLKQFSAKIICLITIPIAAIVYLYLILKMKVLTEEDIITYPYGVKILKVLKRFNFYKEVN